MKRIILMVVATTLLFSCHKTAENYFSNEKNATLASTNANKNIVHDAAYYDSLGILHNQILSTFQKVSSRMETLRPENFQWPPLEGLKKKPTNSLDATTNLPPEKVLEIIEHYLSNDFGTLKNPEVETYLRNIFDRVRAIESFDTSIYKEGMYRLESKILNDDILQPTDKDMLLATAAVARYSGCYWLAFYESQNNNFQIGRFKIFKKLLKAIGVTLADATGAAYNYFANRPIDDWAKNAAWFSEVGYWSINHQENGDSYK